MLPQHRVALETASISANVNIVPHAGEYLLKPTFYSHDVVPDLLSQQRVWNQLNQVIKSVYRRMHALETLDLLPDRQRSVQTRLRMLPAAHSRSVAQHLARVPN